jgi:endonuclease YncB( thermonuclease family)
MPLTSIDFPFGVRDVGSSSVHEFDQTSSRVMKSFAATREFLGAALLCATISEAAASACSFEPQGEGRVSAIIDARSFRMDDGREVRLAGVEIPGDGPAVLASLLAGQAVTLRGETDAPDRYGRQAAFVFVDQADAPVQTMLLERGAALASGTVADKACAAELVAAEAAARQSKRGTWAGSAAIKNAESGDDILARVGQFTVVEGKVLSVRQAGTLTYLNFGRRWTRGFAVTISRRVLALVEAAGISVKALESRRIRVRGFIEARQGPRLEVLRVGQIELAGP